MWFRVAIFLIVLIVSCCFALLRNSRSTDLAHLGEIGPVLLASVARRKACDENTAASYSRYSTNLQRGESIDEQRQECRRSAESKGHQILSELEFDDEAISGTVLNRAGFQAMLDAARTGQFKVLYLYSLSRLARESVIGMPTLKDLVYNCGVRVISVTEGLDTNKEGWEIMATVLCLQHEQFVKTLRRDSLRGLRHNLANDFSVGDHCLGYTSQTAPGEEHLVGRKGAKPHKIVIIDEATKEIPIAIFRWFVEENRSIQWIVVELNRLNAPKGNRASTEAWRRSNVISILKNPKYIGIWTWGVMKNHRNPLNGVVRQEPRSDDDPDRVKRVFPGLALIDQSIFSRAQQRLREQEEARAKHRTQDGRLRGSGKQQFGRTAQHLLQGLVLCPVCHEPFYGGGSGRQLTLHCHNARDGHCTCKRQLDRQLAERLILERVEQTLLRDDVVLQQVLSNTIEAWEVTQRTAPDSIEQLERDIQDRESRIERLIDQIEGSDDPDLRKRLGVRQRERNQLKSQLEQAKVHIAQHIPRPDSDWVRSQLAQLASVLREDPGASNQELRLLIPEKIQLTLHERLGRVRPYYCARFTLVINLIPRVGSDANDAVSPTRIDLELELTEPDRRLQTEIERARQLYDSGMLNCEIGRELSCSKAKVTSLLKQSFAAEGTQMPDGRARHHTLPNRHQELPQYQAIADAAREFWRQGYSLRAIGRALGCSDTTAKKAIMYWYQSRDLPIPTVELRRERQIDQAWEWDQARVPQMEIAKRLDVSVNCVRTWLAIKAESLGVPVRDRRSDRRRKTSQQDVA